MLSVEQTLPYVLVSWPSGLPMPVSTLSIKYPQTYVCMGISVMEEQEELQRLFLPCE